MADEYHWDDNPFARIFGVGQLGRRQRLANETALERAEIAAGPGHASVAENRRQFEAQQRMLADAQGAWVSALNMEMGGPEGTPTPEITSRALRRFLTTPQAIGMGQALVPFVNAIRSGNPQAGEAFTLAPGARRYGPPGPDGQAPLIAENPRPAPGDAGPLGQQRGQEILRWAQAGNAAVDLEPLIPQLESLVAQPGGSSQGVLTSMHNMWRQRLGLPPSTDQATLISAIRTRFVPALHGTGVMTDSDRAALERALPDIGNSLEANRTLVEILRRTVSRAVQRGEVASAALQANTPQAVDEAFRAVNDPTFARRWEQQWVSRTYGIPAEELEPRNQGDLLRLNARLIELNGGQPPPPRVQRYLRALAARIQASGR